MKTNELNKIQNTQNAEVEAKKAAEALKQHRFVGSYTGNGSFGAESPNSLSFSFQPYQLVVTGDVIGGYPWIYGAPKGRISADAYVDLTWVENSVSWYGTDAETQLNTSEFVYYYTAL